MTSIYYKMCVYIYIFMFVQLQSTRFFDNQRSSSCILQTLDLGCHGWPHAHRPPDVCLFWRSHFLNSPKKWGSWSLSKIPRWSNSNMCIIIILKQPHLDLIHSGCDYTNIHTCMYICIYIRICIMYISILHVPADIELEWFTQGMVNPLSNIQNSLNKWHVCCVNSAK